MRSSGTRLQEVGTGEDVSLIGEEAPPPAPPARAVAQDALTGLLFTSLKALSQRTIVALASLVDLALIASAFVLWVLIIANPTVLQLVGVGVYAGFVLCALLLRRR